MKQEQKYILEKLRKIFVLAGGGVMMAIVVYQLCMIPDKKTETGTLLTKKKVATQQTVSGTVDAFFIDTDGDGVSDRTVLNFHPFDTAWYGYAKTGDTIIYTNKNEQNVVWAGMVVPQNKIISINGHTLQEIEQLKNNVKTNSGKVR